MISHIFDSNRAPTTLLMAFAICIAPAIAQEGNEEDSEQSELWITSLAHDEESNCIAGTATGLLLREAAVMLFPADDRNAKVELYRHPHSVWAVAVSPDGKQVASADYRGNLMTLDRSDEGWQAGEPTTYEGLLERWSRCLTYTADGSQLIAGNESGKIYLIDAKSGNVVASREIEASQIMDVTLVNDGQRIAATTSSGKIHLLDAKSLEADGDALAVSEEPLWFCVGDKADDLIVGGAARKVAQVQDRKAEPAASGTVSGWATTAARLGGSLLIGTMNGSVYEYSPGSEPEEILKLDSGIWTTAGLPNGTIAVGTRKDGLVVLRKQWSVE